MIRDEIEEQFQTWRVKDLSELLQLFSSAQRVANPIARNRERRARKIRVSPLRRNLAETVLQTSIGQGLGAAFRASRPYAHEPDMSEAEFLPFGEDFAGEIA